MSFFTEMRKLIKDRLCTICMIGIMLQFTLLTKGQVQTGAADTSKYFPLLRGKMVGVVANNAYVAANESIVDVLGHHGFAVKRIFSPEHGFRSFSEAGQSIANGIDSLTGIPIVSLYGAKRKPDRPELSNLDIVLFDIQDVGVRFYTYISTLSYVMEACA